MVEKRSFPRIDSTQDVFLYHGKSKYEGKLENLSCSGAMVTIPALPELMQPGDLCHLAFPANPDAIACSCMVTRIYSSSVGLQFSEATANA